MSAGMSREHSEVCKLFIINAKLVCWNFQILLPTHIYLPQDHWCSAASAGWAATIQRNNLKDFLFCFQVTHQVCEEGVNISIKARLFLLQHTYIKWFHIPFILFLVIHMSHTSQKSLPKHQYEARNCRVNQRCCPVFGWNRVNFLLSHWYSAVLWI